MYLINQHHYSILIPYTSIGQHLKTTLICSVGVFRSETANVTLEFAEALSKQKRNVDNQPVLVFLQILNDLLLFKTSVVRQALFKWLLDSAELGVASETEPKHRLIVKVNS